jgi:hypothetical protein
MIASRNSQRIMESEMILRTGIVVLLVSMILSSSQEVQAQEKKKNKKTREVFSWVNKPSKAYENLPIDHETFRSDSMGTDVGYCIYLPPGYASTKKLQGTVSSCLLPPWWSSW